MTVIFRGRQSCTCLAAWLPVYEAELLRRGIIKYSIDIFQLIGLAKKSSNTHSKGGAYDIAQMTEAAIKVAREMGAAAFARPYNWDGDGGGAHQHGVLNGCPHNEPARYQIAALAAGYNGLGHLGRGARDTGPLPRKLRTWREGIAWAKAQQAADIDYDKLARTARDRYLARRRKQGLLRPLPLERTQVNGMGATAEPERTAAIVREAAEGRDLLTLCEVVNIDVAKVLGPEWDVAQDRSTPAKAGVAVAVRKSRGRILDKRIKLGVPARLGGRRAVQMRNRYVMVATIRYDEHEARRTWQDKVAATHGPPKRNWNPWWAVWARALRTVVAHDIGADWNRTKPAVQKVFPRRIVRMHHIDGFAIRPFIPSTPVTTRDVGGDHPAADSTYWPSKKELAA